MLNNVLSLFLESRCPLCDRSTAATVCEFCQRQLRQCQITNPGRYWQGDLPLFAWGVYRGALKRAIAALKYSEHRQLGNLLGAWLAQAWLDFPTKKPVTVLPIPLHPQKLQTRGFNQAELIARSFCQLTGYPLKSHGLRRVRETEAMYGLTGHQRENNLHDAFRVEPRWQRQHPASVLIVDDIYTTGTTVKEAARQLRLHNISVLGAATVSVALPSHGTEK